MVCHMNLPKTLTLSEYSFSYHVVRVLQFKFILQLKFSKLERASFSITPSSVKHIYWYCLRKLILKVIIYAKHTLCLLCIQNYVEDTKSRAKMLDYYSVCVFIVAQDGRLCCVLLILSAPLLQYC